METTLVYTLSLNVVYSLEQFPQKRFNRLHKIV